MSEVIDFALLPDKVSNPTDLSIVEEAPAKKV
jgi:hypothetical protein